MDANETKFSDDTVKDVPTTSDEAVKSGVVACDVRTNLFGLPITTGEAVSNHRIFMGSVQKFLDDLKSAE